MGNILHILKEKFENNALFFTGVFVYQYFLARRIGTREMYITVCNCKFLSEGKAWAFSIFMPSAQHILNFRTLFCSMIDFKLVFDQITYTNLRILVFEKVQLGLQLFPSVIRMLYLIFLISFCKCLSHTAYIMQQLRAEK